MYLHEDLRNKKISEKQDRKSTIFTCVLLILCISLFFVKFVWLKCVQVDGTSMNYTLSHGDYLLVDRLSAPKRGDVIVFTIDEKAYIKRIVALSGDSVMIKDGKLFVKKEGENSFEEAIYNGVKGQTFVKQYPAHQGEELKILPGYVFVLGDNRENSTDSRSSYLGPIDIKYIDGVVHQSVIDNKDNFLGKFYKWL